MEKITEKRIARVKLTLTKRTVDALEPKDQPWIAWDDKLIGFGCRVQPSGTKSFIVNYRAGDGGRKAPNKRVVVGRYGRVTPDRARRLAQELLGRVAGGDDPAGERAGARALPTLGDACREYIESGHGRAASTQRCYRRYADLYLGDWHTRPLDAIDRRDTEARFLSITERHGAVPANQCLSFLRSVYRRPCVDHEGLRNPVEQWLAAGGRYHRKTRRRISSLAEVLPRWQKGIEAAVVNPVHRDLLLFGLYTGMRRGEIMPLRWETGGSGGGPVSGSRRPRPGCRLSFRSTRQLGENLRPAPGRQRGHAGGNCGDWVFPVAVERLGPCQGVAGPLWPHHECRRREVLVPRVAQRLHHRGRARTDAAALADQAAGQPCPARRRDRGFTPPTGRWNNSAKPAQRIADRIDRLMNP